MGLGMKQGQSFEYSIIAGWFITALAIFIVALSVIPEESRSDYFWYRVIWSEVLNLLFWGSASFYILVSAAQKDLVTRFGGIAPTISIVTATYAILSFTVMVIHAFIPGDDAASRVHWILQVVFFAGASLSIVFLSISRAAATSGLEFDREKAFTPNELHDLLAVQEASLRSLSSRDLKANVKQLREALVYSLSESASLAEISEYRELSNAIKTLCDSLAGLPSSSEVPTDRVNSLNETAISLTAKTKMVSAIQIRR